MFSAITRHTSTTGLIKQEESIVQTTAAEQPKSLIHRELQSLQNPKTNLTRTMSSPAGSLITQGFKMSNDLSRLLEKCEEGNIASAVKTVDCGIGPSPPDSRQSTRDSSDSVGNSNNNNESSSSCGSFNLVGSDRPTPASTPARTPAGTPASTPARTPAGTPSGTPASTPARTPASTPSGTPASTRNDSSNIIIRQSSVKRMASNLEQQLQQQQQAKFNPHRPVRSPLTSRSSKKSHSGSQSPECARTSVTSRAASLAGSGSSSVTRQGSGAGSRANKNSRGNTAVILTNSTPSVNAVSQDEDDDEVFVQHDGPTPATPPKPHTEEDVIRVIKPPRKIQPVETRSHGHIQTDSKNSMDLDTDRHLGPALIPPYAHKSVDHIPDIGRNSLKEDGLPKPKPKR